MDLEQDEETTLLAGQLKRFVAEKLLPDAHARDEGGALEAAHLSALFELGLAALVVPEARGGVGLGHPAMAAAVEIIASGDPGLALVAGLHAAVAAPLAAAADAPFASDWCEGRRWAAVQIAPSILVPGGAVAPDLLFVGADGSAWRGDAPGREAVPAGLGLRTAGLGRRACEPPQGAPLSAGDRSVVDAALVVRAAVASGILSAAVEAAAAYAAERRQFRRPIADFQAVQWAIADLSTHRDAASLMVRRAGAALDSGDPGAGEWARRALSFAATHAVDAANRALQIHGGNGFVREYAPQRLLRDALFFVQGPLGRDALRGVHPSAA